MPSRSRKRYWAKIAGKSYSGHAVILPVCVRSPGVRGRNLDATLDSLRESGVEHLHVVMCDTLDRWNMRTIDPKGDALKASDQWLNANLLKIKSSFSIDLKRWDDVVADDSFKLRLSLIKRLYKDDQRAKFIVDTIADFYLSAKRERFHATGLVFDEVMERECSTSYLLEEFAGTATYATWYPGVPEAYWGVYVGDPKAFQKLNVYAPSIDLTLPETLAVHLNRLPAPVAGGMPSPAAA